MGCSTRADLKCIRFAAYFVSTMQYVLFTFLFLDGLSSGMFCDPFSNLSTLFFIKISVSKQQKYQEQPMTNIYVRQMTQYLVCPLI